MVNSGPTGNYANGLFTTVTICVPGTSTCQSIGGILVDTGSFGLRILSSALNASISSALVPEKDSSGNTIVECAQFSDGITWGPVETADVKIAGEQASALPIQIIGSPAFSSVPGGCSSAGAPEDSLQKLATNGILGIGNFVQDCPACSPGAVSNPGLYYGCVGSSCQVITVSLAQQVANPVASFGADSNGVIVELPATASTTTVTGSLIFGIDTEDNNALGTAQVLTIDPNTGNINTTFKSKTYTNAGFLDTGSNGFFFLDSTTTGLSSCPKPANGFYCPASLTNLTATNTGTNKVATSVTFSVDNANSLFANGANSVFPTLGGPLSGLFDWGLPFFYGRRVYVAIFGASTSGGVGPYWAY
ncbi:MAG TPA: DUF3443 family protein [Terriglobales bacterium]|nr:DUF3443 family protein [Terriglobales bacterium]